MNGSGHDCRRSSFRASLRRSAPCRSKAGMSTPAEAGAAGAWRPFPRLRQHRAGLQRGPVRLQQKSPAPSENEKETKKARG
jgi:hypothetical protein